MGGRLSFSLNTFAMAKVVQMVFGWDTMRDVGGLIYAIQS